VPSAVPPSFGGVPHSRDRRTASGVPGRTIGAARYRWRSAPEPTGRPRPVGRAAFGPEAPGAIHRRHRPGSHQPPGLWIGPRRVLVPFTAHVFVMWAEYGGGSRRASSEPRPAEITTGTLRQVERFGASVRLENQRNDISERRTGPALVSRQDVRAEDQRDEVWGLQSLGAAQPGPDGFLAAHRDAGRRRERDGDAGAERRGSLAGRYQCQPGSASIAAESSGSSRPSACRLRMSATHSPTGNP
jgi:hypothetical protein